MADRVDVSFRGYLDVGQACLSEQLGQASTENLLKILRVLREGGLVHARDSGRQRLYRLDAEPLRSITEIPAAATFVGDTARAAASPAASVPIEPGTQELTVTVELTYALA